MKIHRAVVAFVLSFAVMLSLCISTSASAQAASSTITTETQPGFTVVGLWVRTSREKEAGGIGLIPQMWQHAMEEGLLENVPHRADNNFTVVYTNYSSNQNGEYTYVLGVRVTAVDKTPDGMTVVNVPAGKYAIVESDTGSLPEVLPKVWGRIQTMPATKLGGERAYKADFEVYPENFDWQNAQVAVHLGLK
jgi:predicted transcriptional regulator YdeE